VRWRIRCVDGGTRAARPSLKISTSRSGAWFAAELGSHPILTDIYLAKSSIVKGSTAAPSGSRRFAETAVRGPVTSRQETVMAESGAERALRYRNSAQHIRIDAQSVDNANERETLLRLAGEFDNLAEDLERTAKPSMPTRKVPV